MIEQTVIDAFNARQTVDLNNIKKMTPEQMDRVVKNGVAAEGIMRNRDFAQFVHQYKFEVCDALTDVVGHTAEDNNRRVALSNQLAGIDGFISTLKRAAFFKQKVVSLREQQSQVGPDLNNEE